ncbi:hypothetical protein MKW94_026991 [Papaver nudicaule]|uniref:Uncharacterized protein n=1 Tax=Papaver nudicaule TaxID=74823 RepID=A0AA42B2W4_PAPNU|nr:hypothetical protein [Papaver nudicaule]
MGLLENFWDDTLAGPRPEKGLKKLHRYVSAPSPLTLDVPKISPSMNICVSPADSISSEPSSPASSPGSPLSPWTRKKELMRRKSTSAASERAEPRRPTVFDWVVISAIDG